jgi:hypothetical protein
VVHRAEEAGDAQDGQAGVKDAHHLRQLAAAHPGHVEVGHYQGEPPLALGDDLQCRLAVDGLDHLPAVGLEHPAGDPAHRLLVVHHEHDTALPGVGGA